MELKFEKAVKLDKPIDIIHKFVGGSLDGQVHSGKAYYVLTDKTVMTIGDEMYAFDGKDTFTFTGRTSRMKEIKETWKAKLLKWLLN